MALTCFSTLHVLNAMKPKQYQVFMVHFCSYIIILLNPNYYYTSVFTKQNTSLLCISIKGIFHIYAFLCWQFLTEISPYVYKANISIFMYKTYIKHTRTQIDIQLYCNLLSLYKPLC